MSAANWRRGDSQSARNQARYRNARVAKLVDARDLKSLSCKAMRVRFPPRARSSGTAKCATPSTRRQTLPAAMSHRSRIEQSSLCVALIKCMTRPQPAPLSRISPQSSAQRRLRWNSASRLVITAALDVDSDARRDGTARHCIACRPQCPPVRLESTNRSIYAAPRTTMRSCLRQKSWRQRSTRRNAHLASSTPHYVSEKKAKSCPPQVLARPASANKKPRISFDIRGLNLERETRLELATSTLARLRSTN